MEAILERTTRSDQKIAKSMISKFRETSERIISNDNKVVKIKIEERGTFIAIPKKALTLLFDILSNMAQGKSITLIPSDTVVSTQQAANMLNISRPHLVKLLEEGQISFKKVGSHRRIELKDILTYDKRLKEVRKEKLNFLAEQAQELNLGY
jgi:excisionase family DNA binding protein